MNENKAQGPVTRECENCGRPFKTQGVWIAAICKSCAWKIDNGSVYPEVTEECEAT